MLFLASSIIKNIGCDSKTQEVLYDHVIIVILCFKDSGIRQNLVQDLNPSLIKRNGSLPSEFSFPNTYNGNITPCPSDEYMVRVKSDKTMEGTWFIMKPDVPTCIISYKMT